MRKQGDLRSGVTFVLVNCQHSFPFGRFHEEWEDSAKSQNINKLVTVVASVWACESVVQNFQGSVTRHFLFPVNTYTSHFVIDQDCRIGTH